MKENDLEQFSVALSKLSTPLNEEQCKKIKSATKAIRGPHTDSFDKPTNADLEQAFPLPPEHEINHPFDDRKLSICCMIIDKQTAENVLGYF